MSSLVEESFLEVVRFNPPACVSGVDREKMALVLGESCGVGAPEVHGDVSYGSAVKRGQFSQPSGILRSIQFSGLPAAKFLIERDFDLCSVGKGRLEYISILTERLIVSARAMGAANEPKRPSVFVGAWGDE